jgi:hypothetical protein
MSLVDYGGSDEEAEDIVAEEVLKKRKIVDIQLGANTSHAKITKVEEKADDNDDHEYVPMVLKTTSAPTSLLAALPKPASATARATTSSVSSIVPSIVSQRAQDATKNPIDTSKVDETPPEEPAAVLPEGVVVGPVKPPSLNSDDEDEENGDNGQHASAAYLQAPGSQAYSPLGPAAPYMAYGTMPEYGYPPHMMMPEYAPQMDPAAIGYDMMQGASREFARELPLVGQMLAVDGNNLTLPAWQREEMAASAPGKKVKSSQTLKRKHQITYLAAQAPEAAKELAQRKAHQLKSKTATKGKYGW